MKMNKPLSIKELEGRWWYRLLKVVYVLGYIWWIFVGGKVLVGCSFGVDCDGLSLGFFLFLFGILFFELIRKVFHYIITGTTTPHRDLVNREGV